MSSEDLALALRGVVMLIGDHLEHITRLTREMDDLEDVSVLLVASVKALRPVIDKAIELANVLSRRRGRKPRGLRMSGENEALRGALASPHAQSRRRSPRGTQRRV